MSLQDDWGELLGPEPLQIPIEEQIRKVFEAYTGVSCVVCVQRTEFREYHVAYQQAPLVGIPMPKLEAFKLQFPGYVFQIAPVVEVFRQLERTQQRLLHYEAQSYGHTRHRP